MQSPSLGETFEAVHELFWIFEDSSVCVRERGRGRESIVLNLCMRVSVAFFNKVFFFIFVAYFQGCHGSGLFGPLFSMFNCRDIFNVRIMMMTMMMLMNMMIIKMMSPVDSLTLRTCLIGARFNYSLCVFILTLKVTTPSTKFTALWYLSVAIEQDVQVPGPWGVLRGAQLPQAAQAGEGVRAGDILHQREGGHGFI